MTDILKVSQHARDAAEGAYLDCYEDAPNPAWLQALLTGKHDDDVLVQAFQRAITAAEERATLAGRERCILAVQSFCTRHEEFNDIAAAIRKAIP